MTIVKIINAMLLKELIDNFCFKWKPNETIWPLNEQILEEFSDQLPWIISSKIFKLIKLNEEKFIERNTTTCNLRVGLFPDELQQINNQTYVCTVYYDIYMILLYYFRCRQVMEMKNIEKFSFYIFIYSIKIILSDDDFGGYLFSNNSWNGILKLIAEKKNKEEAFFEIDFIPHHFTRNDERSRILDTEFTIPQEHLVTILSHKQHLYNDDPFKLFRIFSRDIWLLIMISFILFSFIMNLADGIIINDYHEYKYRIHHFQSFNIWIQYEFIRLLHNFFDLFTLFMGQEISKHRKVRRQLTKKFPIQTLKKSLIIWIFCSFIIRIWFSSDILAVFVSDKEKVIDTFDELERLLISNDDYRIFLETDSTTGKYFFLKYPHLKKSIIPIDNEQLTSWKIIEKLLNGQYFLVVDRSRSEILMKSYPNYELHVSSDGFQFALFNMAIRKDLPEPEKALLLRLSKTMTMNGLLFPIWKKLIHFNYLKSYLKQNNIGLEQHTNEIYNPTPTTINVQQHGKHSSITKNMFSFINIYLIAIMNAFIIFILELLSYYLNFC
ncbi:hypothetical protein BLA29_000906 [Euroglyphus maynei]|uniref:Uncharacterized protein n=1 Tax=Euroglyphus maynei TaxID=6958 RepID=A0A1Y3B901_EURMA|nr:hypothetical protein BLA29_000906 [Euroglyphus maynei]